MLGNLSYETFSQSSVATHMLDFMMRDVSLLEFQRLDESFLAVSHIND